jgi:uncharacterized protein YegL
VTNSNTLPLILSKEPLSRGLLSADKPALPSVAVVYAGFGETAYFDGRPLRWSSRVMAKYRYRYEVDTGDHRRTAKLENSPLPARGDAYFFETTVNVGFKVTDPEEVVRRNVEDALVVVYDSLVETFRPITRSHDIQDAQGAEVEINQLFRRQPMALPEGITIFRCVAQIAPDAAARRYIQSLVEAQRRGVVGGAEHTLALATVRHDQTLAAFQQDARLDSEAKEQAAMAGRPLDLRGLLMAHLAKHPDETSYALELMMRYEAAGQNQRNVDDQRMMDLVRFMAERDLIQAVDVDRLRSETLGRVQEIAGRNRLAIPSAAGWDDDLPISAPGGPAIPAAAPPPAAYPEPEPAPAPPWTQGAAAPAPQQPDAAPRTGSALPVYVVVDESVSDPEYLAALNDGLQNLGARLAATPEAADALRLALLGYAEDVGVRMPMTTVAAGGYVPRFAARGGARLSGVAEYLLDLIPRDIDRLKARGLTVSRPVVYLLCAGPVVDAGAWADGHRQLTDRTVFRYAPNVVACGVGAADPALVARLATRPELGFCAPARTPLGDAVVRYTDFLATGLARLALAHARGKGDTLMERPAGFRQADEAEGEQSDG